MGGLAVDGRLMSNIASACAALSSCAAPSERVAGKEDLLAAVRFDVRLANTTERRDFLRRRPSDKFVQSTSGAGVRCDHADPLACDCLPVGRPASPRSLWARSASGQHLERRTRDAAPAGANPPRLISPEPQQAWREGGEAAFHTGPSATADIESVLVHGAQGVRLLSVLLLPRS